MSLRQSQHSASATLSVAFGQSPLRVASFQRMTARSYRAAGVIHRAARSGVPTPISEARSTPAGTFEEVGFFAAGHDSARVRAASVRFAQGRSGFVRQTEEIHPEKPESECRHARFPSLLRVRSTDDDRAVFAVSRDSDAIANPVESHPGMLHIEDSSRLLTQVAGNHRTYTACFFPIFCDDDRHVRSAKTPGRAISDPTGRFRRSHLSLIHI